MKKLGVLNNRSYQFKLSKSVDISSVFTVLRILSICTCSARSMITPLVVLNQ